MSLEAINFQKSRSHFKILSTKLVVVVVVVGGGAMKKDDPQILDTNVQMLVARVSSLLGFLHKCSASLNLLQYNYSYCSNVLIIVIVCLLACKRILTL